MLREVFCLLALVAACTCDDKWVWKRETQQKARLSKDRDREETTPRNGQNQEINNDYPDYSEFGNNGAFGYGGGPQLNQFTGGFGANQGPGIGRPFPRPEQNPLQGHPSNGILAGPGGPTGIIGRPRPYYNNGYGGGFGGNNGGLPGFGLGAGGEFGGFPPGQGFGAQGIPGQGFGGGFPGQQGLGGFGGGLGFPNVPGGQAGFAQLQQGLNGGGFGNYGLIPPNQLGLNLGGQYGGRPFFDEPEKDNKVEGKSSEKLTTKISNKI